MYVEVNKIVGLQELQSDFESVSERLNKEKELFVFHNNKPAYFLMTIEQYERLAERSNIYDDDLEENIEESLEAMLNKIGKKVFIDYFYIFKEDKNPEEKLPNSFTLNSRRSRSSSARKIFKENLVLDAMKNILQSAKLDEDTLNAAKKIFKKEVGNYSEHAILDDYEVESQGVLKIGKMARILISKLIQDFIISEKEIKLMQDANYSKQIFNLNFPALKAIDADVDFDLQKKDHRGYNRYYDSVINYAGEEYILCSQWYENLNKAAFEKWLVSKLMKKLIEGVQCLEAGTEFTVNELLDEYWAYVTDATRIIVERDFAEEVRNNKTLRVSVLNKKVSNCQAYIKISGNEF